MMLIVDVLRGVKTNLLSFLGCATGPSLSLLLLKVVSLPASNDVSISFVVYTMLKLASLCGLSPLFLGVLVID